VASHPRVLTLYTKESPCKIPMLTLRLSYPTAGKKSHENNQKEILSIKTVPAPPSRGGIKYFRPGCYGWRFLLFGLGY
jgi:hypothetical protein